MQNDSEILPFPIKEEEFSLPESEYATEMNESFPRCKLASLKAECLAEESVLPSHNQATSEAETQKPKVDSRQIKEEKVEDTKENSVVADKKETSREEKKEGNYEPIMDVHECLISKFDMDVCIK